jgi:hypothetical protein
VTGPGIFPGKLILAGIILVVLVVVLVVRTWDR